MVELAPGARYPPTIPRQARLGREMRRYEQATTMAVFFVGSPMFYGSFVVVPLLRGQWTWDTHSAPILMAMVTGVLMGVLSLPAWSASNARNSRALRYCALALTILVIAGIGIPALLMELRHVSMVAAHQAGFRCALGRLSSRRPGIRSDGVARVVY